MQTLAPGHPLSRLAFFLTAAFPLFILAGHVIADIVLSVLAILFFLHSCLTRDWSWCRAPWVKCLLALWIYIIARDAITSPPWDALRRALPFGRYIFFAAALAFWTLQDKTTRLRFIQVLTAAVLFCACDGFLQWFTGYDLFRQPVSIDPEKHIRLTGPFHKQYLGIMLAWLSFPVCLHLLMPPEGKPNRRLWMLAGVATVLLVLTAIALSGERMALLFALFGWFIAIFMLPLRRQYLFGVLGLGVVLIGALAFISPMLFERQILSTAYTFAHWQDSPYGMLLTSDLHVAAVNPLFGVGTNHFRTVCEDIYRSYPPPLTTYCNTHPHNLYLEWLIESGIIGLSLFAAFIALVLRECVKAWPAERLNPVFLGFVIAFILRAWPIASSTSFFSPWGAPPFWLVTAALLACCLKRGDAVSS